MPTSIPAEVLRADAPIFALSVILVVVGITAISWFLLRTTRRDRSILYFGIAAMLYGVRLVIISYTLPYLVNDVTLHRVGWTITFVIGIPFVLFFTASATGIWRKVVWWTVAAQLALAAFGIPSTFTGYGFAFASTANNVLVILIMPVFFLMVFRGRQQRGDRDVKVLRAGTLVLIVFTIYTNLVGIGLLPGSDRREPLGFLFFLCCLGYVSANRAIRNEENLVSIRKELSIAQDIQSSLLPAGVILPNLEIATRYVPASTVAGDFYDFLVHDGRLGILVADVTGHGIPAALAASMVKVAIRSQAEHAANPAEVLAGLNSALHGNLQSQFVTAGYVYLDPLGNSLTYAGAGHPAMLVWRSATKTVDTIEENGLFLGPFPQAKYSARAAPFNPGDRCLLYTDGVLETPGPNDTDFGMERLRKFLIEHADKTVSECCDALLAELRIFAGRNGSLEHDDITIVAVDHLPR